MKEKKKVIIYGLGKEFKLFKSYIENEFEVIGYCDSKMSNMGGYIPPENLSNLDYDYICITSSKYFDDIKNKLLDLIGEEYKEKIISPYEVFGDFRNYEIRDEWVRDKLKNIPRGKVLLDAGAGEQRYKSFCNHLKYIAQDFGKYIPNEVTIGLQRESWDYTGTNIICDIIDMPLEQETVDVILCTEVFEHLKNPILALKEFSRVLKTNGILILTAPFCCLTHMAPYFYYNGFSEYWYKENLEDNGFKIKEFNKYGSFFKYLCQEMFRVENMAERYCNDNLTEEEIRVIIKSIEVLMRLSEKDKGSDEVLYFGSMLVAEKNNL